MSIGDFIRKSSPLSRRIAELMDLCSTLYCGTSTGAANVFTLTPSTGINSYRDGARFLFLAHQSNTGAATGSVSGKSSLSIVRPDNTALSAGDITSGYPVVVRYSSSLGKLVLHDTGAAAYLIGISLLTTGLVAKTGAGAYAARTLTGPAAGISVSNGDGVSGNPTIALANDLSALEGLGSTGIAVRSASDTWVQRSVAAGTGISVSNGDGVSGNPSISLAALFGLGSPSSVTISSGAITVTAGYMNVDTEASAATDDLDTINGGSIGDIFVMKTNNSGRDVTVKHGTGNIQVNGAADITLDKTTDLAMFVKSGSSTWSCNFFCNV